MLTYADLVQLERQTRDQTVLSVYLNGEGADSITRSRWQADLRHSLDDVATSLRDASHDVREDFAARRRLLEERVETFRGEIGTPGWVTFLDTGGVRHESSVHGPVPTMAVWSTGACVAPYIRVLKESRPVVIAVVDSRHARLYRYVNHEVELVERLEADLDFEVPGYMSRPAAQGFHTGTRGQTGTDAARDALQKEMERMLTTARARIEALAGDDGWIVVGGIPTVATAAVTRLSQALESRAMQADLDINATKAQVTTCARESASRLRNTHDLARIREIIAAAEANGVGVIGGVDTMRALDEGRARTLYFTLRYLEGDASELEAAVRSAFDHGTGVEHVSGEAAEVLDGVGGIAAGLRYVPSAAANPEAVSGGATARAS
jgi:hypothetical protein